MIRLAIKLIINNNAIYASILYIFAPNTCVMTSRERILKLAKKKEKTPNDLAEAMDYDHVQSLYRALKNPGTISYYRLRDLSKTLGISFTELAKIIS